MINRAHAGEEAGQGGCACWLGDPTVRWLARNWAPQAGAVPTFSALKASSPEVGSSQNTSMGLQVGAGAVGSAPGLVWLRAGCGAGTSAFQVQMHHGAVLVSLLGGRRCAADAQHIHRTC